MLYIVSKNVNFLDQNLTKALSFKLQAPNLMGLNLFLEFKHVEEFYFISSFNLLIKKFKANRTYSLPYSGFKQ